MIDHPQDALVMAELPKIQQHLATVLELRGHEVFRCATLDNVRLLIRAGTHLRIVVIALLPCNRPTLEPLKAIQNEITQLANSSLPQFLLVSFLSLNPKNEIELEIEAAKCGAHFVSAVRRPQAELIHKVELINALLDSPPFVSIEHT
jgi:hypothetical protein